MRLRNKIILIFTGWFSLGFILLITFVNLSISKTNDDITRNFSTQVIESKADVAASWLTQRLSEIRIIAKSDAVLTMDLNELKPFIHRLNNQIGHSYGNEWGTFAIGFDNGIGWVSDSISIDVSSRPYFKQAMEGDAEYVLSHPVVSKTDNASIVLLCYPLINAQGEKYGFINGAISLDKLSELTESINFYEGTAWIMDDQDVLYTNSTGSIESLKQLNAIFSYYSNTDIESGRVVDQERQHTVFYTPIKNTQNWYLCVEVDNAILMRDTNNLLTSLIIIWFIILFASIILCIYFSRSITKPLMELNKVMQGVEQGNLESRVAENGRDEIAKISHTFNQMIDRINDLMHQIYIEENAKRSAELQVLQSQINPHFLYNTLDTLQWKAYEYEDDKMAELITALSNFFRISLSKGKEFIPFDREIDHVKNYLIIQQYRFSDILDYSFDLDEDLNSYYILKLLLQPLVENAIQHGIKPKQMHCHIKIKTIKVGNDALLQVTDDGVGIDKETLAQLKDELNQAKQGNGYGLFNVNLRCKLIYGPQYGVEVESVLNQGCCVTIRVPLAESEDDYAKNINLR